MKHEEVLKRLRQDPEYVTAEEELQPLLDIANAVLRLRLAKGWSQSELARHAGTKQANISKLENGLANPTIEFLRRVAQALETDLTVHLGPERLAQSASLVYVIQEVRTVKPETVWSSDRPQGVMSTHWAGHAPASKSFTQPDQYEAA